MLCVARLECTTLHQPGASVKNQAKTEYLSVRLSPWESERAKLMARADKVSVSEFVRRLLDEHARVLAESHSPRKHRAA